LIDIDDKDEIGTANWYRSVSAMGGIGGSCANACPTEQTKASRKRQSFFMPALFADQEPKTMHRNIGLINWSFF